MAKVHRLDDNEVACRMLRINGRYYIHFWFVSFSEMVRSHSVYCFPTFQDELEELSSNSSEHK